MTYKTNRRGFVKRVTATTLAIAVTPKELLFSKAQLLTIEKTQLMNSPTPSEDITWQTLRGHFKMNWVLEPFATKWEKQTLADVTDSIEGIYKSNDYLLSIWMERIDKDIAIIKFQIKRENNQAFRLLSYKIACNTSQSGVYKIFTPGLMQQQNYSIDLPFSFHTTSRAEIDHPVIWMQQTDGSNTFTLGLLDQIQRTKLWGTTYLGENGGEAPGIANNYASVVLERTMDAPNGIKEFTDGLFLNADSSMSWFESLTLYSQKTDLFRNFKKDDKYHEWMLNPMWHTWYAYASNINEDIIKTDSLLARELGVTTIEIDGGWNIPKENGYHIDNDGDYFFDTERFPHPVQMIDEMHKKGLRVILHVAPLIMGIHAKAREKMEDCILRVKGEATTYLDPRLKKTHDYLLDAWVYMFVNYHIDGLWYDFLEIPEEPDPVMANSDVLYDDIRIAYTKLLQALYHKVIEIKPDAAIIIRRGYANLNSKTFCTHVWPMDVPQDYNMNRRDVVFMKTYGKGVITHACCTSWTISESEENVARHMASIIMAGVPAFSVPLKESPDSHNKVIQAWLKFYHKHKKDLILGEMRPLLPTPPSAALYTKGKEGVYIGFFEAVLGLVSVHPTNKITIINAFDRRTNIRLEGITGSWKVRVYNYLWQKLDQDQLDADKQNGVNLNIYTDTGCHMIVLERIFV